MPTVVLSVLTARMPPPEGTQLAVFASAKNYTPEYDASKMLVAARNYARRYGVWVVPERFAAAGYLCLCLISPEGEIAGVQRACHLNIDYRGVFRRDDELSVIDTPFGKLALLVDVDANMPQVACEAVRQGATLLIQSQFVQLYDFFEERVLHSALNAALTNQVAVLSTVSGGGMLIAADGSMIQSYSELLPLSGSLLLEGQAPSAARQAAAQLLKAHRDCLTDKIGGPAHDKR